MQPAGVGGDDGDLEIGIDRDIGDVAGEGEAAEQKRLLEL